MRLRCPLSPKNHISTLNHTPQWANIKRKIELDKDHCRWCGFDNIDFLINLSLILANRSDIVNDSNIILYSFFFDWNKHKKTAYSLDFASPSARTKATKLHNWFQSPLIWKRLGLFYSRLNCAIAVARRIRLKSWLCLSKKKENSTNTKTHRVKWAIYLANLVDSIVPWMFLYKEFNFWKSHLIYQLLLCNLEGVNSHNTMIAKKNIHLIIFQRNYIKFTWCTSLSSGLNMDVRPVFNDVFIVWPHRGGYVMSVSISLACSYLGCSTAPTIFQLGLWSTCNNKWGWRWVFHINIYFMRK